MGSNNGFTVQSSIQKIKPTVTLTAPIKEWEEGYHRRNLDVLLTHEQGQMLKRIQLGLEEREAQLKNGKYVSTAVDAVRWMLENIG